VITTTRRAADRTVRPHTRRFEAIGTRWVIETDRELTPAEWSTVRRQIDAYDRTYSRFRTDSLVHRLATAAGTVEFPADAPALIDCYRRLYDGTGGAVTPLVGGTLADLGYDAAYRLRPAPAIRRTPAWDDAMRWDGPVVTTARPVVLDLGAAGKGYLVDILGDLLGSFGVGSFVVDGSGDLLHRPPADRPDEGIRVGLEHPADPSAVIGTVPLSGDALAASAGNRRTWASLHHIVDPRTGEPARDVVATWVVAGSAMVADGLATALFFTTAERTRPLADDFGADWLRVLADGSAHWSPTFEGELF
jgi:thiamine biosynthesis lipoprotein